MRIALAQVHRIEVVRFRDACLNKFLYTQDG